MACSHCNIVRALSILVSCAASHAQVWNPRTGACLRTIESGYGLCTLFAPGNRHAVLGTKEGTLEILDIGASARVASIEAHSGAIWTLAPSADGSGFVSGSADKEVKFWEWELVAEGHGSAGAGGARQLTATHTR